MNGEDMLRKAEAYAQRWKNAGRKDGSFDKERIEELLKKRYEYLGVEERRVVWCMDPGELGSALEEAPFRDLVYDRREFQKSFFGKVEKAFRHQWRKFQRELATNTISSLPYFRDRLFKSELSYVNSDTWQQANKQVQNTLKQRLESLWLRDKRSTSDIVQLEDFWFEVVTFHWCAFLDLLYECLDGEPNFENYYEYFLEMHEQGLGFYIPTRSADFLLPMSKAGSGYYSSIVWPDANIKDKDKSDYSDEKSS